MKAKPRIYIETSVISYLTSRASRDFIISMCQQITRYWWDNVADRKFELVSSTVVRQEISRGNRSAAQQRLEVLESITLLETPLEEMSALAENLVLAGAVPLRAKTDALHIAIAAINGVEYLATWNFKHIANTNRLPLIHKVCETAGYTPTTICTPLELLWEVS